MKTLILEIENDAYQQVMDFISLVPKWFCNCNCNMVARTFAGAFGMIM